jgi:hypothetical protein
MIVSRFVGGTVPKISIIISEFCEDRELKRKLQKNNHLPGLY